MMDVDGMLSCPRKSIFCLYVLVLSLICSGVFTAVCGTSDSDTLVSAVFDIAFISGTQLSIDISVTPQKLITDKVYFSSDIIHASSEELGALKYAVFLMLRDQLDFLFKGASLDNFSMPVHQSGQFFESLDVTLHSAFFNMNASVAAGEFINGFLDMGATISYIFPFSSENGWNNSYNIFLPSDVILDSANTVDVSDDGAILSWHVSNWDGGNSNDEGRLSFRERAPSSYSLHEEIQIEFNIDCTAPSKVMLASHILGRTLSIASYEILPDFITNIEFLPSDGIRLLIKNHLLSWGDIYQNTFLPIKDHVTEIVENSSFNQEYGAFFYWDEKTTDNASPSFEVTMMDVHPPITAVLLDEDVSLSILDIPARAFFGLVNAGGQAQVNTQDINFGAELKDLAYPYNITIVFPAKITLNGFNVFTWGNISGFSGNFSSQSISQDAFTDEHVEEYITVDISKMDLNIFSVFSGSLEMNTAVSLTTDEYYYKGALPNQFSLPEKMQLPLINADAFRLCIEESIFTPMQITEYFTDKKDKFVERFGGIIPAIELSGVLDENEFFRSLEWDNDISSMDALTPIRISLLSKSLYPIDLNVSIFPPSLAIENQTFNLIGFPNKTVTYTLIFPKGVSIEHSDVSNTGVHTDENTDGRHFIEYTIPASSYDTSLTISCQLTASPLYVLSIMLPLILSFVLVIILIALMYFFKKRKRRGKPYYRPPPAQEYIDQDDYLPQPPAPRKK